MSDEQGYGGINLKTKSNEGLRKVYWFIAMTIVVFVVLFAVMWWYDIEWVKR